MSLVFLQYCEQRTLIAHSQSTFRRKGGRRRILSLGLPHFPAAAAADCFGSSPLTPAISTALWVSTVKVLTFPKIFFLPQNLKSKSRSSSSSSSYEWRLSFSIFFGYVFLRRENFAFFCLYLTVA